MGRAGGEGKGNWSGEEREGEVGEEKRRGGRKGGPPP